MHLTHRLRAVIAGIFGLAGLAMATAPEEAPPQSSLNGRLFYEILLGELSVRAEDTGAGFSLMLDAARKAQSPALYRRAVDIALQARAGTSALSAARAWTQADPQSREAQRYLLQILLGLNQPQEAATPLSRVLELTPDEEKSDMVWSIAGIFEHASDKKLASRVVQQALAGLLSSASHGATAWSTIARLRINAGEPEQAVQAILEGHRLDSGAERPMLVALTLLDKKHPRLEEAVQAYVLNATPDFRLRHARALLNQQRIKDAQAALIALLAKHPEFAEGWLVQGLLYEALAQDAEAQNQLQTFLKLTDPGTTDQVGAEIRRGRSQAFMGLADIAERKKDWAGAQAWLERVDSPQEAMRAGVKLARLLARQNRVEEALTLIEQQEAGNADEARLKINATVQILRDSKQYDRAKALLSQMLRRNPGETESIYTLAMVHERLGEMAEMERLLRQIISLKPEDSGAYNALGYSLADRGERLPEAKELIRKALELSPNDPFITDSLGWAEFRSGNLVEAVRLLRQAFESRPDAEIAAHLGEALWVQQQRSQALDVFRRGLELNDQNETLLETIKRLNVAL